MPVPPIRGEGELLPLDLLPTQCQPAGPVAPTGVPPTTKTTVGVSLVGTLGRPRQTPTSRPPSHLVIPAQSLPRTRIRGEGGNPSSPLMGEDSGEGEKTYRLGRPRRTPTGWPPPELVIPAPPPRHSREGGNPSTIAPRTNDNRDTTNYIPTGNPAQACPYPRYGVRVNSYRWISSPPNVNRPAP